MGNFIINNMLSKLRLLNRACLRQSAMPMATQRMYRTELGLDADQLMNVADADANSSVELWKAQVDSLDAIELVIEAENLEKFKKPVHYVNFIKHMEAYKEEHTRLPHEDTKATKYTMEEAFPGVPVPSM